MTQSKLHLLYILLTLLSVILETEVASAQFRETTALPLFVNFRPNASSVVQCMATDDEGQTWMGTDKGLVVYDGYRDYTLFKGTDLQTLIHAVMLADDKILMGTDGGLRVAEKRNLRVLPPQGGVGCVRALLRKGSKIVVGGDNGVDLYDLRTGKTKVLARRLSQVYSLLDTSHGLLIGTLHGLYIFRNGRIRAVNTGMLASHPLVNAMAYAQGGGYWIGTEGALYYYDGRSVNDVSALHSNSIKALCQVGNTLYIGTDDGLYMIANKQRVVRVCQDIRMANSLASNIVWALAKDKWNNLLVGTDRGLSIHKTHEPFRCWNLSVITGSGDGNTFGTLLIDNDGLSLWAGGDNGLISMFYSAGGWKVSRWYRQGDPRWSISHNRIRKLHRLSDGSIIACTDHGLFIIDPLNGKTHNVLLTDGTGHYNAAWAYDIVEDRRGRCWVAAYAGGIFIIDRRRLLAGQGSVKADAHLGSSLIGINVGSLGVDRQGRVWAAAYSAGVDRIDAATLRATHVLKETSIDKVVADADGSIWATMAGKVVRFEHGDRNSQRTFLLSDHSLTPAALGTVNGSLWISANDDVCVLRPNGQSNAFSLSGLKAFSVSSPFLWTDLAGKQHEAVMLGGEDALMAVNIDDLKSNLCGRLLLTGIEVNGNLLCINDAQRYLDANGAMTFHSNENNFKLLFSDNPQCGRLAAHYAYQMEGVEKRWTLLPAGVLQVSFNGLSHGTYRLRVCVVDGQGRPSKEVYSLKVTVLPPWYLTWWAKTIYVLLFLAFIAWGVRFVWMQRELRRERQARNDAMEQSARRAAFFVSLSEKLKMLSGSVLASAFHLRSQLHDKQEGDIDMIRRSGTAICRMASEALDLPLPVASSLAKPVVQQLDLIEFCQLVVSDYHQDGCCAQLVVSDDHSKLTTEVDVVAMSGLLDAIAKFVDDNTLVSGNAVLSVEENEGYAVLSLDVEHLELSPDKRRFAFVPYGENSLALVSQRARMMEAQVSINDLADGHSIIVFKLGYKVMRQKKLDGASHLVDERSNSKKPEVDKSALSEVVLKNHDGYDEDVVVKAVTSMIETHLADADLNVQLLTQLTGYGTKLIYRRVKAVTGYTPVNYIRQMRMQRAAVLLEQGRFAVSEVMYMVGFSTQSYFSKCFSQTFGMTPAEYSRQNTQTNNIDA